MAIACDAPDHCWHGDDYTSFCCCCPTVRDTHPTGDNA